LIFHEVAKSSLHAIEKVTSIIPVPSSTSFALPATPQDVRRARTHPTDAVQRQQVPPTETIRYRLPKEIKRHHVDT
jgi:hypothetical protein